MLKAEKIKETRAVTRTVTEEVTETTGVTLHLTKAHARALQYALAVIGGHREDSARKYTDEVCHAIDKAIGSVLFPEPIEDLLANVGRNDFTALSKELAEAKNEVEWRAALRPGATRYRYYDTLFTPFTPIKNPYSGLILNAALG